MLQKIILISIGVIFISISTAGAYVVDGDLSDWGVAPAEYGSSSDWEPNSGVWWFEEDQTGPESTHLGPGSGGQKFDAEAIYFDFDMDYAYMAVVTGFPKSGRDGYTPGDIAIDFGSDGVYDYGIRTVGTNSGKVYKDVEWILSSLHHESDPVKVDITGSTFLGLTDLVYTPFSDSYPAEPDEYYWRHYVIEARLPLDLFEGLGDSPLWQDNFSLHWTMSCGNDAVDLDVIIPEPSSLMFLAVGLAGLGGMRLKRFKRL